jgi:2-haloacid dehalogenase
VYRIVFLDADGTLFDYDASEEAAVEAAFRAIVGSYDAALHLPAYRAVNRAIWNELERGEITADALAVERFRRLFCELCLPSPALLAAEMSKRYLEELAHGSRMLPGAEELVRSLARRHRLVLVTNGLSRVQRPRIEQSSVGKCFETLVISDEVGIAKPDPAILALACARIGVGTGAEERAGMLMVGDNPRADVGVGAAFGISTCWYNPAGLERDPGAPGPTYEIARLGDLEGIAG